MIREVIATGRDADSAIENGCRELGVPREDVEFEIISLPRKSFFGLKSYPAKVRVYQEIPDVIRTPREEPKAKKAPEAKAPKAQEPRPQQPKEAKPPREPQEAPKAQPKGEPRGGKEPRPQDKPPREPREKSVPRQEQRQEPAPAPAPVEIEPDEALVARIASATSYLEGVLAALGVTQLEIQPHYYAENVRLQLTGTGLGVIIGRRGETLDALQYLTSLVANRGEGAYVRINIDSGNYREKRERTLENLARKLANQAVRTGKTTTLEPMNPYERRIIHGAVSQIKGATSSSIGADPARRVVISSTGPKKEGNAPQGERSGDRGDRRPRSQGGRSRSRGGRPGGERPPRTTPPQREQSQPQEQDLTQLTESISTPLVPPPPPRLLPLQDRPAPEVSEAPETQAAPAAPAAEPKAETPAPVAEAAPQERKLDEQQVKEAPRYGKIEF